MWSEELEDKIVTHERNGINIVSFAKNNIFTGDRLITIDEVNRAFNKMKAQKSQIPWALKKKIKKEFKEPEAFITEQYKQLEEMLKEYRQKDAEIKEQIKKENRQLQVRQKLPLPLYIQKLYEAGLVEADGKTAIDKLDKIAIFLIDMLVDKNEFNFNARFLQKKFLQPNGNKWSYSAARKAYEIANARFAREEKRLKMHK